MYDVGIIGCGPAGIFTALELLKDKPKLKIISQKPSQIPNLRYMKAVLVLLLCIVEKRDTDMPTDSCLLHSCNG